VTDLTFEKCVGLLGATSLIGGLILSLLRPAAWQVHAFSRHTVETAQSDIKWHRLAASGSESLAHVGNIPYWITMFPVWVLPEYFAMMEAHGVRRIVVLSSTSMFTKDDSSDVAEQAVARRLADAESCVRVWAESRGVTCIVLRPTLVYGMGLDKNIAEIARFIRRFRFFPLFGQAMGLRQPVHAEDVASACLAALNDGVLVRQEYNLSGGETLPYREMVMRVFIALGCRPRFVNVPLGLFRIAVTLLRLMPRYSKWSAAMAERMNRDLVFDHTDASRDLGFRPNKFQLRPEDVMT
jgi:nucleoside-diphosphate-sugar epimerase